MTITSLLLRFLLIYPALMLLVGVIFVFFELKRVPFLSIVILVAAAAISLEAFFRKNGRFFEANEKRTATIGLWLISVIYTFLISRIDGTTELVSGGAYLGIIAVVAFIEYLAILTAIDLVKKRLVKQGLIQDVVTSRSSEVTKEGFFARKGFFYSLFRLTILTIVLIILAIITLIIVGEINK